jgi:hypothetical protein
VISSMECAQEAGDAKRSRREPPFGSSHSSGIVRQVPLEGIQGDGPLGLRDSGIVFMSALRRVAVEHLGTIGVERRA